MKQNSKINTSDNILNITAPQGEFYDLFLRAIEIDLENIEIISKTGASIELISPSLIGSIDHNTGDQPNKTE